MRQAVTNCTNQFYVNSTVDHSLNDSNLDFVVTIKDETYDNTFLTSDTYLIDISTDNLVEEFPALSVYTIKTTTHALLSQQSEA